MEEMKNIFFENSEEQEESVSKVIETSPKVRKRTRKAKYEPKVMKRLPTPGDSAMFAMIRASEALTKDEKEIYSVMGRVFLADLEENLKKNHIELSKIDEEGIVFTSDEWWGFLNAPPVSKYISQNNNMIASTAATNEIMSGGRSGAAAMKLKKEIDQASGMSNFNVVLIRVQEKDDL